MSRKTHNCIRYLPGSLDRAIFGGQAFDDALGELIQVFNGCRFNVYMCVCVFVYADSHLTPNRDLNHATTQKKQEGHLVGPLADGSYRKGEWVRMAARCDNPTCGLVCCMAAPCMVSLLTPHLILIHTHRPQLNQRHR